MGASPSPLTGFAPFAIGVFSHGARPSNAGAAGRFKAVTWLDSSFGWLVICASHRIGVWNLREAVNGPPVATLEGLMAISILAGCLALPLPLPLPSAPAGPPPSARFAQDYPSKASPFDALRFEGDQPEVKVDDTWYRPVAIDGVPLEDILRACDKRWGEESRVKRFGEDLMEALALLDHRATSRVTLDLVRLSDGEAVSLKGVANTRTKREAIRNAVPAALSLTDVETDLDAFADGLRAQFAYVDRKGLDLEAMLAELHAELRDSGDEVPLRTFANGLEEILHQFGDGHARVEHPAGPSVGKHTPFLLGEADGGVVAFLPDRSALLDPQRPFVHAVDGVKIDEWVRLVAPLEASGSPQLVQHRALQRTRELELVRRRLGLEASDTVRLSLAKKPAKGRAKEVTLPLTKKRPTYGAWPRSKTRLLKGKAAGRIKGGIGVLRIARMDDDLVPSVRQAMTDFKDTAGLIIDVRGNGGGRRALLAAIGGYLVSDETGPIVANCAAYRLHEDFRDDHLGGSRLLYRELHSGWSDAQRAAIRAFAKTFKPEWPLPEGFSKWHYLVLDRTGHRDEYHYARPVVLLVDEGCFSATDIFAAGLAEFPNVTLMGRPTSGGSARVQAFRLPNSRLEVLCASMASFQPSGILYDGNGVAVDVPVEREPGDLIRGGGDAQMDAAVKLISKKR